MIIFPYGMSGPSILRSQRPGSVVWNGWPSAVSVRPATYSKLCWEWCRAFWKERPHKLTHWESRQLTKGPPPCTYDWGLSWPRSPTKCVLCAQTPPGTECSGNAVAGQNGSSGTDPHGPDPRMDVTHGSVSWASGPVMLSVQYKTPCPGRTFLKQHRFQNRSWHHETDRRCRNV